MASIIEIDSRITIAVVATVAILLLLVWLRRALGGPERLPYQPVQSLLTPAEQVYYTRLRSAVADMPIAILAKVRLEDLLSIPKGTENSQSYRNRVRSKHVDFVLCTIDTLAPLLVIELDDDSHKRRDRIERDAFVDNVMRTLGLPIIHQLCASDYNIATLRREIAMRINPRRS